LSIAGRRETLLTAGRRKVAVVEVVVLGTVRPCLSPLHSLATLPGAGEVTSRIIEVAAVQAEAGVPEGFFLRGVLLTDIWTGRTAGDVLSKPLPTFIETNTLDSTLFTLRIVFTNFNLNLNRHGDRLREVALEIAPVLGTRG